MNCLFLLCFGSSGYIGKMNAGPEILADHVGRTARKIALLQLIFQNAIFGFYRPAAEVQGHELLIGQIKKVCKESLRFSGGQQDPNNSQGNFEVSLQRKIVTLCFIHNIVPLSFAVHQEANPICLEERKKFCVRVSPIKQDKALRGNPQFLQTPYMPPIACVLSAVGYGSMAASAIRSFSM